MGSTPSRFKEIKKINIYIYVYMYLVLLSKMWCDKLIQDEEQELAKELGAAGRIRPKHENDNTGGRNGSGILERWPQTLKL